MVSRWVVACACAMALPWAVAQGSGGAAPAARSMPREPVPARGARGLPAVQVRIEVRTVAAPVRPRPAEPLRPGAVVTTTAASPDSGGSVTVRATASSRPADAVARHVVVANGQQAVLRWHLAHEADTLEFVWTAQGQGVVGSTGTRWRAMEWSVTPRWPGEGEPVELRLATGGTSPDAAQVQTVVRLGFDRWQSVARSVHDGISQEVQVRVSLTGP